VGRGTSAPGIGVQLKRRLHDAGDWLMSMTAFGECLPRHENVVTLSDKTDDFGIPILRIDCSWGPNELGDAQGHAQSAIEMLEAAAARTSSATTTTRRRARARSPDSASTRWARRVWAATRRRPC
jgi:hypothetical protein